MTGRDTKWRHVLTDELREELERRWHVRGQLHACIDELGRQDVDWSLIADTLRRALGTAETGLAA